MLNISHSLEATSYYCAKVGRFSGSLGLQAGRPAGRRFSRITRGAGTQKRRQVLQKIAPARAGAPPRGLPVARGAGARGAVHGVDAEAHTVQLEGEIRVITTLQNLNLRKAPRTRHPAARSTY